MTIEIVKSEIARFLASEVAEVLCIKGKWGVGKTFAWRQYLSEAQKNGQLGLSKYAYVSLFGLTDLDSLRYAVFENTVSMGHFVDGADVSSLGERLQGVTDLLRKGRPFYAVFANRIGGSGAGDAISRATFLAVRDQYVCLDDLERSGSKLEIRDVLGLASMLKEQRHCKVILLLNEEQLEVSAKEELNRQIEKVVDVSLVFEPSPAEAVTIAFVEKSEVNQKLAPKIVKLGITNIRVIKKIERLADRLAGLLSTFREEVLDQGIHAVALGGWSILQPDSAPPIEFIRGHNSLFSSLRVKQDDVPEMDRKWAECIEDYGWAHCDELDSAIFDGIKMGYFSESEIAEGAKVVQANIENSKENNAFSKAWRLYHDSFLIDDDTVLDALFDGASECIKSISPLNLNATVLLLREFGRNEQADELIAIYIAQVQPTMDRLDEELRMWGTEPIDLALSQAFDKLKADFVDTRDPRDVLVSMVTNRSWNEADIELLAVQNAAEFEKIFESIEGPNLASVVKFALSLGAHEGPNHKVVGAAVIAALKAIALKSPLNKRRIASLGVQVE